MKKCITAILLSGALLLPLWGCQKQEEASLNPAQPETQRSFSETDTVPGQSSSVSAPEKDTASPADISENVTGQEDGLSDISDASNGKSAFTEDGPGSDALSFAEFHHLQFCFSSGAGGWATLLTIDEKGNFSGEYFDNDMGDTGENYPNGIRYQCTFNGHFTVPEKMNDYTYSMQVDKIESKEEADSEEIIDGVLYKYTTPYGLEDAGNILIFLPGAPLAEIPKECKNWLQSALFDSSDTELPFYALYNENSQCGFSSYNMEENFHDVLADIERVTGELNDSIENDPLTQAEYNQKTLELYEQWDSALNTLWDILKQTLDAKTMNVLTADQREWIAQKEEAMEKAGAEFEGGSMQPMIQNNTAAEMTRDRVYELMELYLK